MTTEPVKARRVGADRLSGLVARWRNLAESRDQDGGQNPAGWAEHLKRVAGAYEKREKEKYSEKLREKTNEKLDAALLEDKSLADSNNSHAFLGPTLRPSAP
jgi:hypothetical protein